ncbi:MAG: hypothetical protein ABIK44_04770, partial [candidate division WOR-3 bacterium]
MLRCRKHGTMEDLMFFCRTKTFIIDLQTLTDPRIADFLQLGLVSGRLLLPEPPRPSSEADHSTRRAWETIERLRKIPGIKVKLDPELVNQERLVAQLRKLKSVLITNSAELKGACNGLPVVTTQEIYNIFKPAYLPGSTIKVKILKKGKDRNEGIGYLEGGIKVVVENGGNAV